jgi:hypothetical protein
MVDEMSQELILRFLQVNFPIIRLRNGRRFSRGIVIETGFTGRMETKHFLKPQNELQALYAILYAILRDVFGFNNKEINTALLTYLNVL